MADVDVPKPQVVQDIGEVRRRTWRMKDDGAATEASVTMAAVGLEKQFESLSIAWRRLAGWCPHGHARPPPTDGVDGNRCDNCHGVVAQQSDAKVQFLLGHHCRLASWWQEGGTGTFSTL